MIQGTAPYNGTYLERVRRPVCEQCSELMPLDIASIVSGYAGEDRYTVRVPDELLDQPLYNIPVYYDTSYQGPIRTVRETSAATRRAMALSGYNHSEQGMVDIGTWVDGLRTTRPENILFFQALFPGMVRLQ